MTKLNIRWDRYALIAELADRLEKMDTQFGKTMLQKLVYLLQETYDLKLGYSYELYTYGPFCTQLLIDLDQVEALHGVNIEPVVTGYTGYKIQPGSQSGFVKEKGAEFLKQDQVSEALDEIIKVFGLLNGTELELRSTIVFVARDHKRHGTELSLDKLYKVVSEIKPKFTWGVIRAAIKELADNGYIELAE